MSCYLMILCFLFFLKTVFFKCWSPIPKTEKHFCKKMKKWWSAITCIRTQKKTESTNQGKGKRTTFLWKLKKKITCFSNCYYSYICNIFFFSFPKQIQLTKWVFLFVHEIHGQKIAKISFDLHYAKDLFCHFYKNSKYDTVKKTDWLNRS